MQDILKRLDNAASTLIMLGILGEADSKAGKDCEEGWQELCDDMFEKEGVSFYHRAYHVAYENGWYKAKGK